MATLLEQMEMGKLQNYSHTSFIFINHRTKYRIFNWVYILKEIQQLQEDTDEANEHSSVLERENQRMDIQIKIFQNRLEYFDSFPDFF
jgi:galactose-1-phosphate uridylyltransferase